MATLELPQVTVTPLQPKGQSNANIPFPKTNRLGTRVGALSKLPASPEHIAASGEQNSLVYPSDRPKYFMHFGIYDYSREGLMEMGTLRPWTGGSNQIHLPLAETLVDQMEAKWEETPIGWIIGGAAEALKGIANADSAYAEVTKILKEGGEAAEAMFKNMTPWEIAKKLGRDSAPYLQAGAVEFGGPGGQAYGTLNGIAPNRFITILYIGPTYKQYNFTWNFSPRNKEESETLRRVVNVFKKAMSPTIRHTVLWGYPCVFRIMFRPNNEQLYKFRPCVLKRFAANWTPLGRASFYNTTKETGGNMFGSGATQEGNPPEGLTMQATFFELEYWTQEKMVEQPNRAINIDQATDY